MATAPVKSQPLHNFDLPHLRWAHKNHHSPYSNNSNSTHNRFRRRDSPDLHNHGGAGGTINNDNDSNGNGNTVTSLSPSNASETDPADLVPVRDDACAQVSKFSSRTPRKPFSLSSSASPQNHQRKDAADADGGLEKDKEKEKEKNDGVEEGETEAKPWNLRPRKVVTFSTTSSFKKGNKMLLDETVSCQKKDNSGGGYGHPKSSRLRGTMVEGTGHGSVYGSDRPRKVEEKRRLWISLSREEIEEDVYALTGSRPARKAKKRPKTVQKQLDVRRCISIYAMLCRYGILFFPLVYFHNRLIGFFCLLNALQNLFPGLYLVGLTVDSYRVHDSLVCYGFSISLHLRIQL